ncbi:MAG: bifunctional diaminohydroxyphosphoribosylaminopyrimidine deaminase/5-amino-6-(5-phosphoribosylamino)uracil reductase RibD [Saprospiraceae bacterium]
MTTDEKYMQRCFQLAELGHGNIKTNPAVGSVIVHNGKIIGEGYHEKYGEGHAEVNAVASVSPENLHLLKEATIYVSLEPCFHFGKTPPCVNLILKHQIPKVVISLQDPFLEVAGKSIQKLKENGVEVITNVLEARGKFVIRRFLTNIKKQRPYIILKYAQSKDGFLGQVGQQIWLTNPFSKRLVHEWRRTESAILVGRNTVEIDNPQLTNRLPFGSSPLRIVIDDMADLSQNLNIFNNAARTIIVCKKTPTHLKNNNVSYFETVFDDKMLDRLMTFLYQKEKISSIIIEGGAFTLSQFISKNIWDEARIFTSPKTLHEGIEAPKIQNLPKHSTKIGDDTLAFYYNSGQL